MSDTREAPALQFTPVDQTTFGRGKGNCFAATVASITGIPLATLDEELGHGGGTWHENGEWEPNPDEEHWYDRAQRVLLSHGFALHYETNGQPHTGYLLCSGMSPRGLQHSTVWRDGVMVHDPHPSRGGIAAIDAWYWIEPVSPEVQP